MGFGTESTSRARAQADEQASSARRRDVRDRAQGQPRRHPRHLQSHLRLSRRNRGRPLHHLQHHERHRAPVHQCQFLAEYLYAVSRHSYLAAASRAGSREPQTFEDWMAMPLGANMLPWLKDANSPGSSACSTYFLCTTRFDVVRASHFVRAKAHEFSCADARSAGACVPASSPSRGRSGCTQLSEQIVSAALLSPARHCLQEPANVC